MTLYPSLAHDRLVLEKMRSAPERYAFTTVIYSRMRCYRYLDSSAGRTLKMREKKIYIYMYMRGEKNGFHNYRD